MKVFDKNLKGFSLIELLIVTIIIGVLMMASTVYIVGSDEKRKVMEAQGCAAKLGGEIRNFVFNALTSKNLMSGNEVISPSFYIVQFTGSNGGCSYNYPCDKIRFAYSTSTGTTPSDITTYKTLDDSSCQMNTEPIVFYWTGVNTNYIVMNKGFSPKSISNYEVFYLLSGNQKDLLGDAIIGLCLNNDCSTPKEIGKFVADARSQTISTKNCKYYDSNDPTKCKTREDCTVYSSSDPTVCEKY